VQLQQQKIRAELTLLAIEDKRDILNHFAPVGPRQDILDEITKLATEWGNANRQLKAEAEKLHKKLAPYWKSYLHLDRSHIATVFFPHTKAERATWKDNKDLPSQPDCSTCQQRAAWLLEIERQFSPTKPTSPPQSSPEEEIAHLRDELMQELAKLNPLFNKTPASDPKTPDKTMIEALDALLSLATTPAHKRSRSDDLCPNLSKRSRSSDEPST